MHIMEYFTADGSNNLDAWAATWNRLAIYLFSFGFYTLHISLGSTPPSQPPRTHPLELCCCSCDSAECISQNPLAGGSIRFCQRDAIEGNWKWNMGGESSFLFSSCCHSISAADSCLWLLASFALSSSFATLLRHQQQISSPPGSQTTVRPCPLTLKAISFLRSPSTRYVEGASPWRSEYWPVKSGPFSELLASGNYFPSSLLFSQALGHYLISPVLNF